MQKNKEHFSKYHFAFEELKICKNDASPSPISMVSGMVFSEYCINMVHPKVSLSGGQEKLLLFLTMKKGRSKMWQKD